MKAHFKVLKGFSESGLPCIASMGYFPWHEDCLAISDPSAPRSSRSVTTHQPLNFSATSVCGDVAN